MRVSALPGNSVQPIVAQLGTDNQGKFAHCMVLISAFTPQKLTSMILPLLQSDNRWKLVGISRWGRQEWL